MHGHGHLNEVLVFLIAAVCVVPLFQWARSSAVLGYLAAGVLVGPSILGLIEDPEGVLFLAELGVIFLLFTIGLELSIERLKLMRRLVFGLGSSQVVVCAVLIGAVVYWLGQPIEVAVVVGSGLALSSTAFVIQMLVERAEMASRFGRVAFAILLLQDLAIVPLLALLPLLSAPDSSLLQAVGLATLKAVAVVVAALVIGRRVLRPLYRVIAASRLQELFVAVTLLVVLGSGWLMALGGISMALGAFLAGLLLAETEYRHQVEADIRPFKGLLLGLFFMAVGMAIDLSLVLQEWAIVLVCLVALLLTKSLVITLLCLAWRVPREVAVKVGPLLSQGGEFGFVLFGGAMILGLMDRETGQLLLAVVALSMVATPAMGWLGGRFAKLAMPKPDDGLGNLKGDTARRREHVIIAGFGRVGQTVARVLSRCGVDYIALDLNQARVARCRGAGIPVYYGDASRVEVLEAAGIERATAAVITLDRATDASRTVEALNARMPKLPIFVRSYDMRHAQRLEKVGAKAVVPEAVEASLQLGGILLSAVGVGADDVTRVMGEFRADNYARLDDLDQPASRTSAPKE